MTRPVAVIGGGIAGLTAARTLKQHGVPVVLFEGTSRIAGLARSFSDNDGFSSDFGAHFITNRLAARVGVSASCRDVPHYGEAVYLEGAAHSYPFGLLGVPRFVRSALAARIGMAAGARPETAAEWFRAQYGEALADEVAIPLVEAWSGAAGADLAPSVVEKLPGSILHTMAMNLAGRVLHRSVTVGYCHELPERVGVHHVYPEGGVALLCERIAESLRDVVQLESRVERVYVEKERAVGVRVNGTDLDVSAVISTAPVNILPRLVAGSDATARFARFRYRPMVFANLRLRGRGLLPDTVLWTPAQGFPFFRLTETPISMPWLAPAGKTQITCDLGCEVGDPIWNMAPEELGEVCLEHLVRIIPDARERYLGCRSIKTPIAYPVFLTEYEADRKRLGQTTGIAGLYSVGRNGEFCHSLMEDVYVRTTRRMHDVVAELSDGSPARVRSVQPRATARVPLLDAVS